MLPSTEGTNAGEEHEMAKIADISEPASELERLIADMSESGLVVFVFGVGWWTAHLTGATTPVFRGPADRRWWHVQLGDEAANWIMDVRVDEITAVRVGQDTVLSCYVHELYDGQRMRPEKLAAWEALRERYGDRDESRVDQGTLLAPAA
jgi:hypothetical protein